MTSPAKWQWRCSTTAISSRGEGVSPTSTSPGQLNHHTLHTKSCSACVCRLKLEERLGVGVEGEVWSGTVGSSVKAIKKIRHATRAMPFIPATHSDGSVCAAQVQRAGCGEREAGDTRDISVAAAVHHKHRQAHRQASPTIPWLQACLSGVA